MYKRDGRSVRSIGSDRAGIKECLENAYALPQRLLTHNRVPLTRRGVRQLCLWEALKSHVHPHRRVEGRGSLDYRSLPISHYHSRHSLSAPSCGIATPRPSPPSFSFHQIFTHLSCLYIYIYLGRFLSAFFSRNLFIFRFFEIYVFVIIFLLLSSFLQIFQIFLSKYPSFLPYLS